MARALTVLVLLGLAPFAAFLNDNRADARVGDVLPWALATLVPAVIALLLVAALRGTETAARLGPVLGAVIYLFYSFHVIAPDLEDRLPTWIAALIVWTAAAALVAIGLWRVTARSGAATAIMVIAGLMFALPALGYAVFRRDLPAHREERARALSLVRGRVRPDVYLFLVDAYSRADVLKRIYHYDNHPFLAALRARGFRVASQARSDYLVTNFSVPSILNMGYLKSRAHHVSAGEFLGTMHGDSRTVATFEGLGYRYVQAPSSWPDDQCSGEEDLCIDPLHFGGAIAFNEATWAMLSSTPLAVIGTSAELTGVTEGMPAHVARVLEGHRVARPFFAYAHTMLAHPPWRLRGPSCRYIGRLEGISNTGPGERTAYVAGVQCANSQLLRAIDVIDRHDPSAVIVLQADHGAGVGLDWQVPRWRWPPAKVDERSSPLSALRLPRRCRGSVPDTLAAVNTMRVVFNCITDSHLPLLPTRRFVANPDMTELREWHGVSER